MYVPLSPSLSGYVPFNGAGQDLNMGAFKVTAKSFFVETLPFTTNTHANPFLNNSSVFIGKGTGGNSVESIRIGLDAGKLSTGDRNVHIGNLAGQNSIGSNNFYLGTAGNSFTGGNNIAVGQAMNSGGATFSVAMGFSTMGNLVGNNSQHIVLGFQAGNGMNNCSSVIAMGINSAREIVNGNSLVCIGDSAGAYATGLSNSFLFGNGAGQNSVGFSNSTAIGTNAGLYAVGNDNVLIGFSAGYNSKLYYCNAFGYNAGTFINASDSTYFGRNAGQSATFSNEALMFGYGSGSNATNSHNAILFGKETGFQATNIPHLVAIGNYAGYQAVNSGHSLYLGDYAGYQDTVSNIETGAISSISATPVDSTDMFNINDVCTVTSGSGDATVKVTAIDLGEISTITITNGGNSYLVGDLVYATTGNGTAEFEVATVDGPNAPITAVSIGTNAGIGYVVSDVVSVQNGQIQIDAVNGAGEVTAISILVAGTYGYIETDSFASGGSGVDLLINVDAVGSTVGAVLTLTKNTGGSEYSLADVPFSGGTGLDLFANIDSIINGKATVIERVAGGTSGYVFGGNAFENPAVNGLKTLWVYINTLQNIVVSSTSIAIGRYAGTGGFSNSMSFGRGVKNSASLQANFGNVLFLEGIYNSDTQSSTPTTNHVVI